MVSNPKPGDVVQLWYARQHAHRWPLHGRVGVVRVVSSARRRKGERHGPPRSHGIDVDGVLVVVPCGNLRRLMVMEEKTEQTGCQASRS